MVEDSLRYFQQVQSSMRFQGGSKEVQLRSLRRCCQDVASRKALLLQCLGWSFWLLGQALGQAWTRNLLDHRRLRNTLVAYYGLTMDLLIVHWNTKFLTMDFRRGFDAAPCNMCRFVSSVSFELCQRCVCSARLLGNR